MSFLFIQCFHTFAVWKHFLYLYPSHGRNCPTENYCSSSDKSHAICRWKRCQPFVFANGHTFLCFAVMVHTRFLCFSAQPNARFGSLTGSWLTPAVSWISYPHSHPCLCAFRNCMVQQRWLLTCKG